MKYPSINKQPTRSINIPELSGGLNLRDGISAVNDNQLTDCKNIWFKDAILKTRPGMALDAILEFDEFVSSNSGHIYPQRPQTENAARVAGGRRYTLVSQRTDYFHKVTSDGDDLPSDSHIQFFWVGKGQNGIAKERLPSISTQYGTVYKNHFVIQNKKTLYCFAELSSGGDIYKLEDGGDSWVKLADEEIYAPIIMTHCKPTGKPRPSEQELLNAGGVMFEGYNLLGNYCKRIWSTYNAEIAAGETTKTHFMQYGLLNNVKDFVGKTVTAKITDKNGNVYTHSVTVTTASGWNVEQVNRGDNIYLAVVGKMLNFFASPTEQNGSYTTATISENDYVEDNMVVTEPCPNSKENLKKIFAMTRQMWFGGDAAGISGGSRVFLGANTDVKEKSLVLWSGLNNPLYFPENCYAYVGNNTQSVTAFGRQSDMLVIFKERETYLTQYVRNSNITASDLINQSVVDYAASSVYFPMIQLHAGIGCDCPDSIELCRNRLVWACTDGNVYTLCDENQFSERTIFKVSDMISRRLKTENLSYAMSADIDGRYFLIAGAHVYVMEYESYGYTYVASYSKAEDAQLRIPWWYWELPEAAVCAFTDGAELIMLTEKSNEYYTNDYPVYRFEDGRATDGDGNAIATLLQTKIFDFGAPAYTKNVPLVNIAFGNNGGEPVTVSFVSESGNCGDEEVTLSESEGDEYSPEFVHNRQLRPTAHTVTRFGVRLECSGIMSVDAISLNYRLLGGAR